MVNMTLSEELKWRGLIQQTTVTDFDNFDSTEQTFYHGFDASADSQTIGNLAAMMLDKVFIRHGWTAVLLAGGATSLIGDPGGKDKERQLQTEEIIANNVAKAELQLQRIIGADKFKLVNNIDWTKKISVLDFLRNIGKHYSMTPLIQRDYIAKRLGEGGSGISYTEFSYTLLQGMDFLYLYDKYNVTMQLGGSDQWGNCLSGVELIRKTRGQAVHTMTLPLIINKATGKKFGKSEEGAIWLDESKTSVFKFFQFWINIDDAGVEGYLKVYTELDKQNIEEIMDKHNLNRSERIAQKALAGEVTKIVHGKDRADSVIKLSEVLFNGRDFKELKEEDFKELKSELGVVNSTKNNDIISLLVESKLVSSKGSARQLIASGAIYLNGHKIMPGYLISDEDFNNGYFILRRGKNDTILVQKT